MRVCVCVCVRVLTCDRFCDLADKLCTADLNVMGCVGLSMGLLQRYKVNGGLVKNDEKAGKVRLLCVYVSTQLLMARIMRVHASMF